MTNLRFRHLPAIVPGKLDVFMADPRLIVVEPDYNCRDMTAAETVEHVNWLADEIRSQSYNPEMPLTVKRRGDDIVLIRGHCRLAACLKLIGEGFELVGIPVMQIAAGTSEIDLIFDQEASNSGLRLDQFAKARLCLKARKAGVADDEIARRMHWKSIASVKQHLDMLELSEPVKDHVRKGNVSATTARHLAKSELTPEQQAKLIADNLEENKRIKGKKTTRVTPKQIKKATAPKALSALPASQPPAARVELPPAPAMISPPPEQAALSPETDSSLPSVQTMTDAELEHGVVAAGFPPSAPDQSLLDKTRSQVEQSNGWHPEAEELTVAAATARADEHQSQAINNVIEAARKAVGYHKIGYIDAGMFDANTMIALMDKLGEALDAVA